MIDLVFSTNGRRLQGKLGAGLTLSYAMLGTVGQAWETRVMVDGVELFSAHATFPEELVRSHLEAMGKPLEAFSLTWQVEERFRVVGEKLAQVHWRFHRRPGDPVYEMRSMCIEESGQLHG